MKKRLTNKYGDALPLTKEVVSAMKPIKNADKNFIMRLEAEKKKRGRPAGRNKAVVNLSIDRDVLEMLRKSGKGWQSRVNALLRAATGLNA